jgi:MFS family permease
MTFENFKSSFLSVYLEEQGVPLVYHGWIIALSPFFYILSSNLIGRIIEMAPRRIFMFLAFISVTISLLMMGPTGSFPDELWLLYVGTGLIGFSSGFIFIPILPESIEAVYIKRNLVEGDNEDIDNIINDKTSALYGLFYAIGAIISPYIGSVVYNYDSKARGNWVLTCDVFSIGSAIYTLIFLVFNILPDIHLEKEQREAMLMKKYEVHELSVIDEDNPISYAVNDNN